MAFVGRDSEPAALGMKRAGMSAHRSPLTARDKPHVPCGVFKCFCGF